MYLAVPTCPLDLTDQGDDDRVVGPVVVAGPGRGEVEREELPEQHRAEAVFES